ncbi:hypothetical protein AA23498_0109 [Acetobacter nitrogenifigens DSM 23921 = NBRC 105050]|uniref:Uncharacterized protein n=1 Tax=Acetobacter nitrogenifigens DSM 23921 = NBRC 105050 TaxID=1120919 RepID=A0A511X8U8_9PROT|nr:hypothetical protein [Acetobacter nitrogenifigens]GBQ87337.1 hypothetical protein AA23498_0109 [Acetobacter nitrogenifigens DSM 23921 = NBRC 105050]GEN59376.1 hypothetical protein ANI02nite_12600 [Acetobacter nitrogenifigens DSM 23921 = NBRC 105050]
MSAISRGDIIAFREKFAVVIFVLSNGELICAPLEIQPAYDHRAFIFLTPDMLHLEENVRFEASAILCVLGRTARHPDMAVCATIELNILDQIESIAAMEIRARKAEDFGHSSSASAIALPAGALMSSSSVWNGRRTPNRRLGG